MIALYCQCGAVRIWARDGVYLHMHIGRLLIALGALACFAGELSPLMLSVLTSAIMIVVAVWESISLRSAAAK